MITDVAVVQTNRIVGSDAQADAAKHANRRAPDCADTRFAQAHPEMLLRDIIRRRLRRLAAARCAIQKLLDLQARSDCLLRRLYPGQRVRTGIKYLVDPLRLRRDQFQVAVDQRARVKKLETVKQQNETAEAQSKTLTLQVVMPKYSSVWPRCASATTKEGVVSFR